MAINDGDRVVFQARHPAGGWCPPTIQDEGTILRNGDRFAVHWDDGVVNALDEHGAWEEGRVVPSGRVPARSRSGRCRVGDDKARARVWAKITTQDRALWSGMDGMEGNGG